MSSALAGFLNGVNRIRGRNFDATVDLPRNVLEREIAALRQTDVLDTTHFNMTKIFITDLLKAYPVSMKNHNKVTLPQSMLQEIHSKKVWDNREKDKPLVFALTVADPETTDVLEETHVGVEAFTAPPGKIGLPYKTALSLTKDRGISWLKENPLIYIRLVEVDSAKQSSMKVQPRGRGFFLEDESVVQLDIKTVLQLTLKDHLVLTVSDWIPLFWDGNRFELVVKDLQPGEVIDVLNTDLTVEMLPSEETEQTEKEKQRAKKRVDDFMSSRETRQKKLEALYANYTEPKKGDEDVISFRVRLPKGGTLTKNVLVTENLSTLVDLVDLELYRRKFVPMHLPPEGLATFYNFVYAMPRKAKKVLDTNKFTDASIKTVLESADIRGKMIVLMLEMIKEPADEEQNKKEGGGLVHIDNDWIVMADRLETCLQEDDSEAVELLPPEEMAEITAKLVAVGCDAELASKVARLYGNLVNQIINMGYEEQLVRAAELLESKRGDIQGVINALLE